MIFKFFYLIVKFMKPIVFYNSWNPFKDSKINFNKSVSISVDTFEMDEKCDYKILIIYLTEPTQILPNLITDYNILNKFDKIYTHNEYILNNFKNSQLIPFGSCWINFEDFKSNKQNHISFVTSSKTFTDGHILRQRIYEYFSFIDKINELEIYQHKSPPYHNRRNDFFETSKFHVAVENCRETNYFSEKLIDCFASKTIPIYYGCPNIGEFFNTNGIIIFDTMKDLEDILHNLNVSFYDNIQNIIEENYERSKEYWNFYERIDEHINNFVKNQI